MKTKLKPSDFALPALLLALSVVPVLGGVIRMQAMARATTGSLEDVRFLESPAPVIIHVVSATIYSLLGAFQFSASLRRRWPRFHRCAGVSLVLAGLLVAGTGLWMTVTYRIPPPLQGPLLYGARLLVGLGMIGSLLIATVAIYRGRVARHEAYMVRAYALAQGAGTQVFLLAPWMLLSSETGTWTRDILMTAAWALNLAVAEVILGKRRS